MIVSFFGHSNTNLSLTETMQLNNILIKLLSEHDNCKFYLGGYGNFDNVCLNMLTKLKSNFNNFDIVFVTPYFTTNYSKLKIAKYNYDYSIYPPIENSPLKFAIINRNRWMVSNSDFIIFYVNHTFGGAYSIYKYAITKRINFINISNKF